VREENDANDRNFKNNFWKKKKKKRWSYFRLKYYINMCTHVRVMDERRVTTTRVFTTFAVIKSIIASRTTGERRRWRLTMRIQYNLYNSVRARLYYLAATFAIGSNLWTLLHTCDNWIRYACITRYTSLKRVYTIEKKLTTFCCCIVILYFFFFRFVRGTSRRINDDVGSSVKTVLSTSETRFGGWKIKEIFFFGFLFLFFYVLARDRTNFRTRFVWQRSRHNLYVTRARRFYTVRLYYNNNNNYYSPNHFPLASITFRFNVYIYFKGPWKERNSNFLKLFRNWTVHKKQRISVVLKRLSDHSFRVKQTFVFDAWRPRQKPN